MSVHTIVVGVDPSDGSDQAVRWAAELAGQLRAKVVAVHAFEPLAYLGKVDPPIDFHALRVACERDLDEQWCAPLRAAGVRFEARVVEGTPVEALVDAAEAADADLVVVGARGQSTLRGLVLGSTSLKLPHSTTRPVCIVHPTEQPPSV